MPDPLTLPTIHSNGTSAAMLKAEYDAADEALYHFIQKWGDVTMNGRDYYPQGPEAFTKAVEQREEVARHIAAVVDYITEHRKHLHA